MWNTTNVISMYHHVPWLPNVMYIQIFVAYFHSLFVNTCSYQSKQDHIKIKWVLRILLLLIINPKNTWNKVNNKISKWYLFHARLSFLSYCHKFLLIKFLSPCYFEICVLNKWICIYYEIYKERSKIQQL